MTLAAFISAWFSLRDIDQMEWWDALPFYIQWWCMLPTSVYPCDRGNTNHPIYNIQEGGEGGIMLSSWPTVWLTGSYSSCNRRANVAGIVSHVIGYELCKKIPTTTLWVLGSLLPPQENYKFRTPPFPWEKCLLSCMPFLLPAKIYPSRY